MKNLEPSSRQVKVVSDLFSEYRNCNRWAIIVGISEYQYADWNLKYADRDAEAFSELLQTDNGGGFNSESICKLINARATTENITKALRSFLQKPAREDLVVIYFACHGSPDLNRPDNVYILTYDTEPNDIAGTALPMREINLALTENLLAEKVIILADTCHSAAIANGIGRRSTQNETALVNRYLQEVSRAKSGIALITSAEANEASFEDVKWGGGHGVFTYYLIEGMRGAADLDQNGIVSIGELFEYVRDQVKQSTAHSQHPCIGTNPFDRNLPVSINAEIEKPIFLNQKVGDYPFNKDNASTPIPLTNSVPSEKWITAEKRYPNKSVILIASAVGLTIGLTMGAFTISNRLNKPPLPPPLSPSVISEDPIVSPLPVSPQSLSTPGLEIWVYPQQDHVKVTQSLNSLSVKSTIKPSDEVPAPQTNAIWFGENVEIEDIKVVASQLVKSGVPIRAIGPFKEDRGRSSVIEIGADREIERTPNWTVEQINQSTEFTRE